MVKRAALTIRKFFASLALLSLELLIVLGLFVIALISFVFVVRRVFLLDENEIDHAVFNSLQPFITDVNTEVMLAITFFGSHLFLIPANLLLLAYFLFIKKHRWYSIRIPAIALSTTGVSFGLKQFFNRPRPDTPLIREGQGLSFPSGHALISFCFYGLIIYIIWESNISKTLKWISTILLLFFIFLIGFSRIYLRFHYASDVIAGFCTGLIWLVISIWVLKRLEKFSRRKVDPVVEEQKPHAET